MTSTRRSNAPAGMTRPGRANTGPAANWSTNLKGVYREVYHTAP